MGLYNTYANVQLKVGQLTCNHFNIGDKVQLSDGVYVGYEGVVVVHKSKLIAVFPELQTKWGHKIATGPFLNKYNPIVRTMKRVQNTVLGRQVKGRAKRVKKI